MTGSLWRIIVYIDTRDLDLGMTREVWEAQQHRDIVVASGVDPHGKHEYARGDLHAAFRWQAGLLARIGRYASRNISLTEFRAGHRCDLEDASEPCGFTYAEGIDFPGRAVDEPGIVPHVYLSVPTEHAEEWVEVIEQWVAQMIADDLALPPAATDHGGIDLADAHAQPRGATPR